MFKKKEKTNRDKGLKALARTYKKKLERCSELPPNSLEMFRTIRKAGL